MTRLYCVHCREAIENGTGHIRTETFHQVAWCELCWLMENLARGPASIPQQRRRMLSRARRHDSSVA